MDGQLQRKRHPELIIAIVALAGLVWLAISVRNWMGQTREDLGSRIVALESKVKGESEQFNGALARLEQANARLVLLEQKMRDSMAQQESLERMYKSMQRNRDETALVEVEQLVNIASQQLRLLGNVESAILALQQAENRLGNSEKLELQAVRKALSRDLLRLRSLPKLELIVLAQQLNEVFGQIERLPLISDIGQLQTANKDQSVSTQNQPEQSKFMLLSEDKSFNQEVNDSFGGQSHGKNHQDYFFLIDPLWWTHTIQTVVKGAWSDLTQLIRVRKVTAPDVMMMAPSQAYFIRENLRLRLLNARLSLLSRQQQLLREDLQSCEKWLQQYFDNNDVQVIQARTTLNQIRKVELALELPSLQDSLGVLKLNQVATDR
jgi:uroporphyrin-III C-methyltransferase